MEKQYKISSKDRLRTTARCLAWVSPALLVMTLLVPTAGAAVLYEQNPNFDTGFPHNSFEPDPVFGGTYSADAFAFAPGQDRIVTSLDWWGAYSGLASPSGEFIVQLFTDSGSGPGTVINPDTPVTPTQSAASGGYYQFSYELPSPVQLSSGTPYYLSIRGLDHPFVENVVFQWLEADNDVTSGQAWEFTHTGAIPGPNEWNGHPSIDNFAFRLNGNIVPEPMTLMLLGGGLGALGVRRRFRKKA